MWGVWATEEEIHIIPCTEKGDIISPHTKDVLCKCRPEIIQVGDNGKLVMSHNQIH